MNISPASRPAPRGRFRRFGWVVLLLGGALVLALIAGAPPRSKAPLDPTSTEPDGTRALMLLLTQLGDHVQIGLPPAGTSQIALLLADHLNAGDRAGLQTWIRSGGTLVLADPGSALSGVALDRSTRDALLPSAGLGPLSPQCPLPALAAVAAIEPSEAALLRPVATQVGCFPAGAGDFLVAYAAGAGIVVVVGGPGLWTNADLGDADNSVLAASLLAPRAGETVSVVPASRVGGGSRSLVSLISPKLDELFWQLLLALVLVALWRGRRLGRPVRETSPVELPASQLVVAHGNLLQEGGHRGHAAAVLRSQLRRRVAEQLGIDPTLPPELIAELASDRIAMSRSQLLAALAGAEPATDGDLVVLAQIIETAREELSRVR